MRGSTFLLGFSWWVACLALIAPARADEVRFQLESDSLGTYPPVSGATVSFEVFVDIVDVDSDGADTQGLAGFSGDLLTDVGTAPSLAFAAIADNSPYTHDVRTPLWTSGTGSVMLGGFGMGFIVALGTPAGDDIYGPGAFMPFNWDPDVSSDPGRQPYALHGIGYGSPQTAVDIGGHPFDPAYGDARAKWYLLSGSVAVPDAPGTYEVRWEPGETSVIRGPQIDLNNAIPGGYTESATVTGTVAGDAFLFTVTPEPTVVSVMLLAVAGVVTRRRR